jgi:tRNA threonylcarbamoyladenosine biosynthesis protein TsaE
MIGQALGGGEVLALLGDLGTGKTVLVRGLAAGLGAQPRNVRSPTFALIHAYQGRLPLIHADLYRIESVTELDHLGLTDYFDGQHVLAIEWADRAGSILPEDRLELRLSHQGKTVRNLLVKARGPSSRALLSSVITKLTSHGRARQIRKGRQSR